MQRKHQKMSIAALSLLTTATASAGSLTVPNSFSGGTPAVASEVNGNFAAVESAVNDNDSRIATIESQIQTAGSTADLLTRINELESFIDDLRVVMSLQNDNQGNPAVVFSGVNLHVNNGEGATESINGLGNLIVGYDEPRDSGQPVCSDGAFRNETECLASGAVFALSHKSGSHTLVVGPFNNYSQYAGLAAGTESTVNGTFASALGRRNSASGAASTVVGGSDNVANGEASSVSGGLKNRAFSELSSVAGGESNTSTGSMSSIAGGLRNTASGAFSTVSGGEVGVASGNLSHVSGGVDNTASGFAGVVSGGRQNVASGDESSVSGGAENTASGVRSSVSGGRRNTASAAASTVGGGADRATVANDSWRAGNLEEAN